MSQSEHFITVRFRHYHALMLAMTVLARSVRFGALTHREAMNVAGWLATRWPTEVVG